MKKIDNIEIKQIMSPYVFPGLLENMKAEIYIIESICKIEEIDLKDIRKKKPSQSFADIKKMMIYFLFIYTNMSRTKIGFILMVGQGSIMRSISALENLIETEDNILRKVTFYNTLFSKTLIKKRNATKPYFNRHSS